MDDVMLMRGVDQMRYPTDERRSDLWVDQMNEQIAEWNGPIDLQRGFLGHEHEQLIDEFNGRRVDMVEMVKDSFVAVVVEESLLSIFRVHKKFSDELENEHEIFIVRRLLLKQSIDGLQTVRLEKFDFQCCTIIVIA